MGRSDHAIARRSVFAALTAGVLVTMVGVPAMQQAAGAPLPRRQQAAPEASAPVVHRPTPLSSFVAAVYADLFHRAPTAAESLRDTSVLAGGGSTPAQFAHASAPTDEARAVLVRTLYDEAFGRSADPAGLAYWVRRLGANASRFDVVVASFFSGSEYYTRLGARDPAWIAGLYRTFFGRAPDAGGTAYWSAARRASSRTTVVLRLYNARESAARRITRLYGALLGRGPDQAGEDFWLDRIGRESDAGLAAALMGSREYLVHAQERFAGPSASRRLFTSALNPAGSPAPCRGACLSDQSANAVVAAGTLHGDAVTVDADQRFQSIAGFGFALTDTAAYLIDEIPNDQGQRDAVIDQLFDPAKGIGVSWVRIVMAASDFTVVPRPWYSYRPTEADAFDVSRPRPGSPRGDSSHIIPVLQSIIRASHGQVTFFANPHSAPAWMKGNNDMWNLGGDGCLLGYCPNSPRDLRGAYVQYLVDFVKAYQANGIPITALGVQNEPGNVTNYPGGNLAPGDQLDLIRRLKEALRTSNPPLNQQVWAEFGSWEAADLLSRATDPRTVDGLSYHCYFGPPQGLDEFHAAFPQTSLNETECTQDAAAVWPKTIDVLIQSSQHWASVVANWNMALDPTGGPQAVCSSTRRGAVVDRTRALQAAGTCTTGGSGQTAPLVVSGVPGQGQPSFTREYYEMGHFSKFVRPGAVRIGSSALAGIPNVAFQNRDGSRVLVVHNTRKSTVDLAVNIDPAQHFEPTAIPADGIATFVF